MGGLFFSVIWVPLQKDDRLGGFLGHHVWWRPWTLSGSRAVPTGGRGLAQERGGGSRPRSWPPKVGLSGPGRVDFEFLFQCISSHVGPESVSCPYADGLLIGPSYGLFVSSLCNDFGDYYYQVSSVCVTSPLSFHNLSRNVFLRRHADMSSQARNELERYAYSVKGPPREPSTCRWHPWANADS